MEAVNAGYILAHLAKREQWTHLSQAIDAGVTVPLNVMHFKELSGYIGGLLAERKNGEVHPLDEDALKWEGNDALGSVSMIVPSHVRIAGGLKRDNATAEITKRLMDCEVAQTSARTLRTLLEAGFCYSSSSSHGQNLYANGLMSQADNSDLVALGDYHGRQIEWTTDSQGRPVYKTASANGQRATLIFHQLESDRLLTPKCFPMANDEVNICWEQVLDTQQAFWHELIGKHVVPEALDRMLHYVPLMRTEFNIAASLLLLFGHDGNEWEAMAADKRATLAEYEAGFGVLTEYDAKVENNLHELDTLQYNMLEMVAADKLRAYPIIKYLRTGDEQHLLADPILAKAVELTGAIEAVTDRTARDELLNLCAKQFGARDLYRLDKEPDFITAFEGLHYDLLDDLITTGRIEDAKAVLNTLLITTHGPLRSNVSLERDTETNEHKFARLLLEPDAPYQEILEKAQFEAFVQELGQEAFTGGTGLFAMIRSVFDESHNKPKPFSVVEAAKAAGFKDPRDTLKAITFSMINSEPDRRRINEWSEIYWEKFLATTEAAETSPAEYPDMLDELDALAAQIGTTYPELELGHNSSFASRCAETDPARAQTYFNRAMAYYQMHYTDRAKLADQPEHEWGNYDWMSDRTRKLAVAERYTNLGLPRIAYKYAKDDLFGAEW